MTKKMLRENKGIVVADALVAVLLMSIFLGVISSICYSIYMSASFTKRNSEATNYGISIIEYIDKTDYNTITYENLINYINNTLDGSAEKISAKISDSEEKLVTPYRAKLYIEKYNEISGNIGKEDLIKTITIQIEYNLGEATKKVEFQRVKQK